MRLKRLWIDGFKNLNNFELDFSSSDGVTVLIGNNGSGKSNVLEAISALFASIYLDQLDQITFKFEIEYSINNFDVKITKKREPLFYRKKLENITYKKIDKNVIYNVLPLRLPHVLVNKPYLR